ncbi:hypothetical protein N7466_004482 [Penicillium verhagenii]|uniref:uncharacterized protein n=1 Tax=Penicillium verhagenii TaxID=1562060 RepID=UPI00254548F3|nr:uncharacterized protein N7466_004482 [Penicillium verhagenii]KAJ5934935.1 hypothetical protein N7466_004482 [Penicillium verhagenii]
MSLFYAKEASACSLYQPKIAQSMIAQLIRGMAFLHSENIIHSELYGEFGKPYSEAVVRRDIWMVGLVFAAMGLHWAKK